MRKARTVHLLVISKMPEFTPEGEVVPGQCEPYTGGWRLRLLEDGRDEAILAGTYYEVRRVQRRCLGKSADEARSIAAEAAEAMKTSPAPGTPAGGDANESTQILGMNEVRRAMLEMELTAALDDIDGRAEWINVSQRNGVAVASVVADLESVGPMEVGEALGRAFDSTDAGLVVDLGGREPSGPGLAGVLRALAERAEQDGRFLGLVGASEGLVKVIDDVPAGAAPRLYPDLESALAAAVEAGGEAGQAQGPPQDPGRGPHEE